MTNRIRVAGPKAPRRNSRVDLDVASESSHCKRRPQAPPSSPKPPGLIPIPAIHRGESPVSCNCERGTGLPGCGIREVMSADPTNAAAPRPNSRAEPQGRRFMCARIRTPRSRQRKNAIGAGITKVVGCRMRWLLARRARFQVRQCRDQLPRLAACVHGFSNDT